uniref:C-type lectin domain-containing protein n=2 Tax=Oryzias melastigma TaxID=30732 RepID=A0A3B3DHH0_ORYME
MERLFLYLIAASALCGPFSLAKHHYLVFNETKTWTEAQSFCREKYADLATVDNMEDMNILKGLAVPETAWIGLYDDVNSWKWSMSDPNFYKNGDANFRNWKVGEPNNDNGHESCTMVNSLDNGKWNDVPCNILIEPICCNVTGLNVTFVYINKSMNWSEALRFCREHHTDLVSVRNMEENQKIMKLIPAGKSVWIGLYRDTWKWADGSNSSFRNWRDFKPNNNLRQNESCAVTYFGKSGQWDDRNCDNKYAFICYAVPMKKYQLKLKLQGNSSLNLTDPVVLEGILRELKQRLKDQGVDGEPKLSWKKQSNGKIFN